MDDIEFAQLYGPGRDDRERAVITMIMKLQTAHLRNDVVTSFEIKDATNDAALGALLQRVLDSLSIKDVQRAYQSDQHGVLPARQGPAATSRDPYAALPSHPGWKPRVEPVLPPWAAQRVRAEPELRPKRFKAQLWHNGYTVHLGMYATEQERDQAQEAARFRRSVGLPIK